MRSVHRVVLPKSCTTHPLDFHLFIQLLSSSSCFQSVGSDVRTHTIDNPQHLPRITLFEPGLLYFRGKQCQQIYPRDSLCLVWDLPGCMGFTDLLLTNQFSGFSLCMRWSCNNASKKVYFSIR